jgi:DNA-binding CsgD family transcriptional regulator
VTDNAVLAASSSTVARWPDIAREPLTSVRSVDGALARTCAGPGQVDVAGPGLPLRGRAAERGVLDRLLASIRAGHSQVLVVRGEAGIGKTALLDYLLQRAPGCAVARSAGVETETGLAFAGLHQLCAPMLGHLDDLPGPQGDALAIAFGLRSGNIPDGLAVGLATISLLAAVAREMPLVCVVDDAQWLDRASAAALAFAARRLAAEPVALVFAAGDSCEVPGLAGLAELPVLGLDDDDARALLESVITGPLEERVRDRIVAEAHGNPSALLQLPGGMTPEKLAGGFGLPDAPVVPGRAGRAEAAIGRRLATLPPATRLLLLVAAAEPAGDQPLVRRASSVLGIQASAAVPAAAAGLIDPGDPVRFRHPLIRSAVYRAASPEQRASAHRALAQAADPDTAADLRAWHRAQAAPGLDEDIAAELESLAGRAGERGGLAAAAAFYERSAALTSGPARRAERALAAAQGKVQAGALETALRLLAAARAEPLDALQHARAELLHAQVAFAANHGRDAPRLLISAARQLEPLDGMLAREAYRDAFCAAAFAGRLADDGDEHEVAGAVLAADWGQSSRPSPPGCDLLLDGLAVLIAKGYAAGAPLLRRALAAFATGPVPDEDARPWLWLACRVARILGDDARRDLLTDRQVRLARAAGALALLPVALAERVSALLAAGDLDAAASLAAEEAAVITASGTSLAPRGALFVAAWQGRAAEVSALTDGARPDVMSRGEGMWLADAEQASAVLLNSTGRYRDVIAAAEQAVSHLCELGLPAWACPELIEAAARTGKPARAAAAMARLSEIAGAGGTDWATGIEARSRALISDAGSAEPLFRQAIERLARTRARADLARARLLYGEWLRRAGRRTDARGQLRAAADMLGAMGAAGFADRARRELAATGETIRRRAPGSREDLTAQEAQIARLAADGQTNPEIGARLFISARTVEWHLRKIFAKLGVASRRELRAQFSPSAPRHLARTAALLGPGASQYVRPHGPGRLMARVLS